MRVPFVGRLRSGNPLRRAPPVIPFRSDGARQLAPWLLPASQVLEDAPEVPARLPPQLVARSGVDVDAPDPGNMRQPRCR